MGTQGVLSPLLGRFDDGLTLVSLLEGMRTKLGLTKTRRESNFAADSVRPTEGNIKSRSDLKMECGHANCEKTSDEEVRIPESAYNIHYRRLQESPVLVTYPITRNMQRVGHSRRRSRPTCYGP
ncbi:uncharacterized protein PGTG_13119 [Puccinia graminis f. sp. tritici CRL 75-36-700-3]|uniref:Uncharacterized protein n=1 Tax=Puccinia graminis f. sp. tritici (strain CRL 75-36-700-3 / race SCCL) TaxID=418459 RepID=E3KR12_PUCGT|nr:uncharacterized protein PGTG_13119 [Puccinia graminis f. sp. tritici CRL 75-36-700-3]EFP86737.1 hypothetical protein PGTG_13119 [Puccinia graminis f. sp. tritici CRL 75-36-700-3]